MSQVRRRELVEAIALPRQTYTSVKRTQRIYNGTVSVIVKLKRRGELQIWTQDHYSGEKACIGTVRRSHTGGDVWLYSSEDE